MFFVLLILACENVVVYKLYEVFQVPVLGDHTPGTIEEAEDYASCPMGLLWSGLLREGWNGLFELGAPRRLRLMESKACPQRQIGC